MPRAEVIAKTPPVPCSQRPCYKDCKGLCQEVEDWVNYGSRGRNSRVLLANEAWSDESTSVSFVDYASSKHGIDPDSIPDLDAESALQLMHSLRMKPSYIDIIERRAFKCQRVRDVAIDLGISSQSVCHKYRAAKYDLVRRLHRRRTWKYVSEFDMPDRHRKIAELYFHYLYRVRDIAVLIGSAEQDVSHVILRLKERLSLIILSQDGGLACEAEKILEKGTKSERKDAIERRQGLAKKVSKKAKSAGFKSLMEDQFLF